MLRYLLTYRSSVKATGLVLLALGIGGSAVLVVVLWGEEAGFLMAIVPALIAVVITASICGNFSHSLHCDGCKWVGSLADLTHNGGICPLCKGSRFTFTVRISEESKIRWLTNERITTYEYFIIPNKTYEELLNAESMIWKYPPTYWWKSKTKGGRGNN
nr:hypothetical protein [candidate division Zixibacteria bacterium]